METNLVLVQKSEIYTTSKVVSEQLGVKHMDLIRTFDLLFNKNIDLEKKQGAGERHTFQWKISWAIFVERDCRVKPVELPALVGATKQEAKHFSAW